MKNLTYLFILIFGVFQSCSLSVKKNQPNKVEIVYESDDLLIEKLSENLYQHTSYLQTNDFGKVPCNGMIVVANGEAIVLDTTTDAETSGDMIHFLVHELHLEVVGVVATHFHEDCVGGLDVFHERSIPSYAHFRTIELLKDSAKNIPQNGFEISLDLEVGKQKLHLDYFGEGHTTDNIVGYFPKEKALFGGCLVKEMNANKGYLGDANPEAWPFTIQKLKATYPEIQIVIPGHGKRGGKELLDYTIQIFKIN
jgi:metallo-beta-lactamase class B